jgi:Clp amino terminal domain, pathogenicity island component
VGRVCRWCVQRFRRVVPNYIGTEHILLALLELEDGTGVLAGLGADKATAEAKITGAVAASIAAHQQK